MTRPSPALVIALLALAGAWGGPAVAQKLVGSRDVKNNSLTHRDVRDRSLRGADLRSNTITGRVVSGLSSRDIKRDALDGFVIDESTLAQVPRAAAAGHADSAASASTANQLAGARVVRLGYSRPVNGETTTLLDEGGLRIEARCTGAGTLDVHALPTGSGGGLVRVTTTQPDGGGSAAGSAIAADNDFRQGDSVSLLGGGAQDLAGTLTWWAPSGDTVTVDYLAQDSLGAGRGYQCLLAGTAVHALP